MARRKRNDEWGRAEALIKLILLGVVLLALVIGGGSGFAKTFSGLLSVVLTLAFVALGAGVLVLLGVVAYRFWKRRNPAPSAPATRSREQVQAVSSSADVPPGPLPVVPASALWTVASIREALDEIDWYQFEKFCAALLRADGYQVERKGGAQPDGGVDLIVEKGGVFALIQCKHWRTWVVQEKVVREMLGSMTHFKVSQGAIYTLKGWTAPALSFATDHAITLLNGDELAASAASQLDQALLEELLRPRQHHCPKCESPMVLRTGNFESFWGCSRYPVCRGKLNQAGAR